ncbi:MAG TPA: adenosylcobinamide amidohydrolase [Methanocorpusculum sp.]|nr:adenosylcobinamide amidohydrolase [Methanocorpusculum sp.]
MVICMRYYLRNDTLIIRGDFRAASNGAEGGLKDAKTLLNVSIPRGFSENAAGYLERISARNGFLHPYFGLLTAVPMQNLCIAQYDYITAFVTAAVSDRNRTINIIVTSAKPLTDAALLGAMMTVTEAKMKVIAERKLPATAQSTDAVIVAAEKNGSAAEEFAGPLTEVGMRIAKAVSHALTEAFVRFDNYLLTNWGISRGWGGGASALMKRKRPSFFILSRYGGEHWNEWVPEGCPYHPCHNFAEQQCDFCYCPLYPCKDTELSEEIDTPAGKLWSCMDCRFIHEPAVVKHLKENPEAGMAELKAVRKKR